VSRVVSSLHLLALGDRILAGECSCRLRLTRRRTNQQYVVHRGSGQSAKLEVGELYIQW